MQRMSQEVVLCSVAGQVYIDHSRIHRHYTDTTQTHAVHIQCLHQRRIRAHHIPTDTYLRTDFKAASLQPASSASKSSLLKSLEPDSSRPCMQGVTKLRRHCAALDLARSGGAEQGAEGCEQPLALSGVLLSAFRRHHCCERRLQQVCP